MQFQSYFENSSWYLLGTTRTFENMGPLFSDFANSNHVNFPANCDAILFVPQFTVEMYCMDSSGQAVSVSLLKLMKDGTWEYLDGRVRKLFDDFSREQKRKSKVVVTPSNERDYTALFEFMKRHYGWINII